MSKGSPLNRVSFLRTDHTFLSRALKHPTTSFLLFNNLAPLGRDPAKLEYVSYNDVKPLIGEDPYSQTEEELISSYNSARTIPQLLFLGLDESSKSQAKSPSNFTISHTSDNSTFTYNIYTGAPYFALDVTPRGTHTTPANSLISTLQSRGLSFLEGRMHTSLPASTAAIYAQSRALLDWNARNPFCAQCGQPTLSINAGTKRTCPPTDWASLPSATSTSTDAAKPTQRPDCATRKGVHNVCFPRTDPTIIVAVLSADSQRVLLGRQKRWPQYWYSTLAGFVEPAESVEEAVRREVWEESGVLLGRVVIHSTQPWPYPANLMIGCVAQAVGAAPGSDSVQQERQGDGEEENVDARGNRGTKGTPEEIVLKHDPELEDAKWVSLEEVREALRVGTHNLLEGGGMGEGYREGALRLPPRTAIANQLLEAVVNGGWNGLGGVKI
ncbi:MAG: hypothetical protein Q9195_004328 [Heterodermia aff. obscurata]